MTAPGAGPAAVADDPDGDGARQDGGDGSEPATVRGRAASRDPTEHRSRASQSFWTLVVGVPAVFSVLRLGVEAGGELQTTLLLVANVGPVNLAAALFTTAARLVSAGLVAIFAIGAVLAVASEHAPNHWIGRHPPLFARWRENTPAWVVVASFGVALATWPILYLPLLLPAAAAAFQFHPTSLDERRVPRLALLAALLTAYALLLLPTLREAWGQREFFPVLAFAAPPLLALFVSGSIPAAVARPLALVTQVTVLGMLAWTALPVITTPVLPLTVTTVQDGAGGTEDIRGHVITVDDASTVILQERGGVRYVPVDRVESQVLCPTEEELPRHRLRVRDFHVEDSLLEGLGRRIRPIKRVDAACRTATDGG
ncbi:hypothetical protein [Plantactinospora sp. CA-290183]|uniref:hypothetical protein n=1 Tax=Plantactinospora sp. CA-290183 TaxID=3240006 RepID=UPI003D8A63B6